MSTEEGNRGNQGMGRAITRKLNLWIIGWSLGLLHCSPSNRATDPKPDRKTIEELTLYATHAELKSPWTVHLKKKAHQWVLISASDVSQLGDTLANSEWVSHLLDLLESLKTDGVGPQVPLENLGLNPPHYAIRWSTASSVGEIKIGNPAKDPIHTNITWDGTHPYLAKGGLFPLLRELHSWDTLRWPQWTTTSPDDVNELEITRGINFVFFAQRDGSSWSDRNHRLIPLPVDEILDRILNSKWEKMIDAVESAPLSPEKIQLQADFKISLKVRLKGVQLLYLKKYQTQVFGWNPLRPQVIFVFQSSILRSIPSLLFK